MAEDKRLYEAPKVGDKVRYMRGLASRKDWKTIFMPGMTATVDGVEPLDRRFRIHLVIDNEARNRVSFTWEPGCWRLETP
ncbi:MAG: hypothetical protein KDJ36_00180 [Hyphomicrobiaceae bacterium]|nr:hypothetical protein [Hyphomicrobiaceae bacterium]